MQSCSFVFDNAASIIKHQMILENKKCLQFIYLGFDIMFLYTFSDILAFIFWYSFVK